MVEAKGVKIGGGNFQVIAGPCSVEGEGMIVSAAKSVQAAGAKFLVRVKELIENPTVFSSP